MFGRRPDGTRVRDLPDVRRFMPFVSPRRNESVVYFETQIDVEKALAMTEARNRHRDPARPLTLFHVILAALARILHERPSLNRFTAGGRVWQRHGIWITFSAKMRFEDGAPLLTLKRRIDPERPLEEMVDDLLDSLARSRRGEKSAADSEVSLLLRLWPPITFLAMRLVRLADFFGMLPRSMIDSDPLYCSAFVANLGSVGLDAGYHHLWEHGNNPIFCVIGRIHEGPDGRRRVTLKFTYDERVEDGLYCAR
ncbi:MAG: hypothetical protein R3263_08230, partial [Myxococcota bacterium]|nr:hypothetical protein [Myxococcota bacterium]